MRVQSLSDFFHCFTETLLTQLNHRTDEMRPEWFKISGSEEQEEEANKDLPPIPFDKMWDTDHIWLPWLFEKQNFAGRADFKLGDKEGTFVVWKWWYGTY